LNVGGEMIYSTCTLSPEENEMIVNNLLEKFNIELEEIDLPLKTRPGITEWEAEKLNEELKKCVRLYPQDNDTDGFFVAKIRKLGEERK
jgi:16S rRNA C967 or C1407 C5-methylase (RsmB/RsmF family)